MQRYNAHFSFKDNFNIFLIIVVSTILAIIFQSNQIIDGDQLQMLEKGYHGAILGEFLPYGNAASTVGNVPGSLSSYIVGYPLHMYMHPYSPVAVLILLRVLGIIFFINALAKLFSAKTCVIATAFYSLAPWFLYDELVYNPAYLSFGAAVFLNMLVRLRAYSHRLPYSTIFFSSMMLALSAGYCLQLHFSWPVLVVLCGVLYLRKDIKISFLGIFVGLLIVGASLIPYINELIQNNAIRTNQSETDRYIGYGLVHVYPMLKGLWYWFRYASLLMTQKALVPSFADSSPMYLEILRYIYLGFTQLVGAITLMVSMYATYKIIASSPYTHSDGIRFVRSCTIASLIAILVVGALSTITFSYWHLIIMFAFALLPVLALIERSHRIQTRSIVYVIVIMLIFDVVSAVNSQKFNMNVSYKDQVNYLCLQKYTKEQCNLTDIEAQSVLTRSVDTIFKGQLLESFTDKKDNNQKSPELIDNSLNQDLDKNDTNNLSNASDDTKDKKDSILNTKNDITSDKALDEKSVNKAIIDTNIKKDAKKPVDKKDENKDVNKDTRSSVASKNTDTHTIATNKDIEPKNGDMVTPPIDNNIIYVEDAAKPIESITQDDTKKDFIYETNGIEGTIIIGDE